MRVSIKSLPALLLCAGYGLTSAGDLNPPTQVQVTSITGSKSPTKGYFAITTAAPVAGCEAGFWLPASDPNYLAWFERVKLALADKTPIIISADRQQTGPDPSDKFCKITPT